MLAVLLIPGPTNALLATAAHSQGLSKTFWLIPMEWLGYAYGISFGQCSFIWQIRFGLHYCLFCTSLAYYMYSDGIPLMENHAFTNNLAKIIVIFAHVNYSSQL